MFNVTAQKDLNDHIFDGFYYQLFQAITYLIHKCSLLQDLFLRWSNLNKKHKFLMHYLSYYVLDKDQLDLYAPIMQSLNCWDTTQDNEGACGFHEYPLDFKFDADDERKICELAEVVGGIAGNLLLRPTLCEEIRGRRGDRKGEGEGDEPDNA